MKPILIAGTSIVNLALISYTLFILSERKGHCTSNRVLGFLTAGVILDATATICMIIGSTKTPFTMHGILGYSSLTGMIIDAILIWRSRIRNGAGSPISLKLHKYSIVVYFWWITAYLTGAMLVMMR